MGEPHRILISDPVHACGAMNCLLGNNHDTLPFIQLRGYFWGAMRGWMGERLEVSSGRWSDRRSIA
jgi:hypothetical protein